MPPTRAPQPVPQQARIRPMTPARRKVTAAAVSECLYGRWSGKEEEEGEEEGGEEAGSSPGPGPAPPPAQRVEPASPEAVAVAAAASSPAASSAALTGRPTTPPPTPPPEGGGAPGAPAKGRPRPPGAGPGAARPGHVINLQELRRLASQGVPDEGGRRALTWRVLLGYLPSDTSRWPDVLQRDRTLYRDLVAELFVRPGHHGRGGGGDDLAAEGRKLRGSGVTRDGRSVRDVSGGRNGHRLRRRETPPPEGIFWEGAERDVGVGVGAAAGGGGGGGGGCEEEDADGSVGGAAEAVAAGLDLDSSGSASVESAAGGGSREPAEPAKEAAGVPVHSPEMLIPARVREQWRESGRDADVLAHMSSSAGNMNALLVVDDRGNKYGEGGVRTSGAAGRGAVNDDPLAASEDEDEDEDEDEESTTWSQFFENASLLDEIRKDVVRTHPDLTFFLEPMDDLGQRRYAAVERILFVWAKLNKGVRYVQGMNEIVATLYFVLANDENEEWACEAESDTYFLFNALMVEMRDVFVPDLDNADTGIQGRISNMIALLSLHDPEVRCHLDDCGIDGSFYSIRWLTTLLSREFLLPDTIRLWDSMFASTHKDNFLRYVCVSMVTSLREELLRGDFGMCLRLLQAFPPTDVDRLLEMSRALWIYESQVTLACQKGGISLMRALQTISPPRGLPMAYGLPGGQAASREEQLKQDMKREIDNASEAAKEATDSMRAAGKSFMGSAKGFLRSTWS